MKRGRVSVITLKIEGQVYYDELKLLFLFLYYSTNSGLVLAKLIVNSINNKNTSMAKTTREAAGALDYSLGIPETSLRGLSTRMALKVLRSIPGSAEVVKSVTNLRGSSQECPMGQRTAVAPHFKTRDGTGLHLF